MDRLRIWWMLAWLALPCAATAAGQGHAPLRLHGFLESLEIAPVLLAADGGCPGELVLRRGGIANLVGKATTGYGDPGIADVATNAETQLLRHSVDNPGLRAIMTITEGRYRIVARRSAGIGELADLKGKRVGTMSDTSAAYFLERMLASAGLAPGDVTTLGGIDLPTLSDALVEGRIDALAMWSPEAEEGELGLGEDAIAFDGDGVYREIFNLNTTTAALADPARRAAIKALVRAVVEAGEAIAREPSRAQQLVAARMSDYPEALVRASWPHHRFVTGRVPDLLDEMVVQEAWLARAESRSPRDRATLARLIDYTLLDEVLAERARR